MAKVFGGLLSLDSSKTFGKVITYSKWRGIPYARLRVTPSNPRSAGQVENRAFTALAGKVTKAADKVGDVVTFIKTITPGGQVWNSFFVREMLGTGNVNIKAAQTAYELAGNATVKGYFDTAAAGVGMESATVPGASSPLPAGLGLWAAYAAANRIGVAEAPTLPAAASQTQVEDFAEAYTGKTI